MDIKNYGDIEEFRKETLLSKSLFCKVNKINRGSYWRWSCGVQSPSENVLKKLNEKYELFSKSKLTKEPSETYKKIDAYFEKGFSEKVNKKGTKKVLLIPLFLFIIGLILFMAGK